MTMVWEFLKNLYSDRCVGFGVVYKSNDGGNIRSVPNSPLDEGG